MLLRMQTAQSVPYDCNQSTASQIAHRYARARPGYAHRLMGGIPRALSQNGYGFAIDPAVRTPWLKPYQTVVSAPPSRQTALTVWKRFALHLLAIWPVCPTGSRPSRALATPGEERVPTGRIRMSDPTWRRTLNHPCQACCICPHHTPVLTAQWWNVLSSSHTHTPTWWITGYLYGDTPHQVDTPIPHPEDRSPTEEFVS